MAARKRERFVFWLNTRDYAERRLAGLIDQLKREGAFTQAIRDGLRLVADLRAGQTAVLCELFPWVAESLQQPAPTPSEGDILRELARLRAAVEDMRAFASVPPPPRDTPLMHPVTPLRPAVDDDDDVALTVRASTATDSGRNFLASLMSLQH